MAAPSDNVNVDGTRKTGCAVRTRHTKLCAEDNGLPRVNAFQRCTDLIDENIQLFRASIGITAAVGVLLVARSIRVYHKFRSVSDIPDEFITKHVKLFGRFVKVKTDPIHIVVEHTPILQLQRFRRERNSYAEEGLPIHLAGVELDEGGKEFLADRLASHPSLRFHLLHRNRSNGLDCIVELTKWKFLHRRLSLNEELLRNGLAKVAPLTGLQDQSLNARLTQRLLAAELRAERKSRGLWARERAPTTSEAIGARLTSVGRALAPGLAAMRKLIALPRKAVKGLWGALRRRKTGRDG